jgi:hypothetical protein
MARRQPVTARLNGSVGDSLLAVFGLLLEDMAALFRDAEHLYLLTTRGCVMADPENQTLRVLIEFRNEFREFKSEAERRFGQIETRLEELEKRLDVLNQSFSGMVAGNQYLLGGIQGRFERVERRLAALEQNH